MGCGSSKATDAAAPVAAAVDFVYRHQPTQRDAMFGFDEQGTLFAFGAAPPAADVWTTSLTLMANLGPQRRLLLGLVHVCHDHGGEGLLKGTPAPTRGRERRVRS